MRLLRLGALALPTAALAANVNAVEPGAQPKTDQEWMVWVPGPETLKAPELAFVPNENDASNYEKYYYFHRAGTSFAEALGDIRFCDELARGLATRDYYPNPGTTAMYGLGGAIGGAIGGALANAIYGSAEKRAKRRTNMRRCMHFQGYDRYGLSKERWETFNFEEGNSTVPEAERQQMLATQALVATGAKPATENLGL